MRQRWAGGKKDGNVFFLRSFSSRYTWLKQHRQQQKQQKKTFTFKKLIALIHVQDLYMVETM